MHLRKIDSKTQKPISTHDTSNLSAPSEESKNFTLVPRRKILFLAEGGGNGQEGDDDRT